ncbi:hypothetical protein ES703_76779 [subsurface metagenome]
MKKEDLIRYVEPKTKVKVSLSTGDFYSGIILVVGDDSILFEDKFGSKIMISYDVIKVVAPWRENGKKKKGI